MDNKNNPYLASTEGPQATRSMLQQGAMETASEHPRPPKASSTRLARVFAFSYIPSIVVAISVVPVWIYILTMNAPLRQRRTNGPDIVELAFILITTLPSAVTCMFFTCCYCFLTTSGQKPKIWPAVVFGTLSGLLFNAFTAISVIEYCFDW